MFGRIIPAPFAMPVIVTSRPAIVTRVEAAFGTGVGRHDRSRPPRANGPGRALRSLRAGRPSGGRPADGSMITPVENGSTASGAAKQPSDRLARGARTASPASPVPALALPVLTTSARIGPPSVQMFATHLHRGGGEAVAREDAGDRRRARPAGSPAESLRSALRMPASAQPSSTPGTAADLRDEAAED